MKFRIIITSLLILLFSMGFVAHSDAAPYRYHRTWSNGAWGWRSFHNAAFYNRHNWRYRDNRVGIKEQPDRFYRPWTVKRREFHNSSDNFSHRFYR